jgi:hypothetical protein
VIEAIVAIAGPLIERIWRGCSVRFNRHRRAIAEANLLIGMNANRRTVAGGFAFAAPNRDDGFVTVIVHVKPIVAGLQRCECLVRCIDFVFFAVFQPAHMKNQRTLMELKLNKVVSYVGDGKTALGTDAHYPGANADFCAGILVCPDVVGVSQWPVDLARDPVTSPLRLHRN